MQNEVGESYNRWASQYDTNTNRTRDLEATALRELLSAARPERILEMGCGTGKNTVWLAGRCQHLTAVDLSPGMLGLAREKVQQAHVQFQQGDMNSPWTFASGRYDLVVFSLVLEHIEDLASLFKRMAAVLKPGALVYIGELHPFKQYGGSKARFETAEGTEYVTCYTHHVSDFTGAAQAAGLQLLQLREYFDEGNREAPPRILALLFTYTP